MKFLNYLGCSRRSYKHLLGALLALTLGACSSGSNAPARTPAPPLAAVAVSGVVTDGPVVGGTISVFTADQVLADPAVSSIVMLTRDPADGDQFMILDSTDAEDDDFKDTPPNLESVAILGDAGSSQRVNLSMQTTLVARIVRSLLDPDGNGVPIGAPEIKTEIETATASVLSAFATDSLGRDLYPDGFDPFTFNDDEIVHRASSAIGFLMRAVAQSEGLGYDQAVAALAADAADGEIDGAIPVDLAPSAELEVVAAAAADVASAGSDEDIGIFAVGPCSSAAVAMMQACAVDVLDDVFESTAICQDIADDDDRADCLADVDLDRIDKEEECEDVFDARLELCADLSDAAHEPMFGPDFAANFVDPLEIGITVPVNPWFPLVTGNRWVYEGGDETIEVVVTDQTKLIEGITCVVVIDTVSEDGQALEITQDWYAQDLIGNVWYCGEISRNNEIFEGDDPETPELVDIDGSWKAGREGSEAGILLPFAPIVGETIRQEVAYGEAEDVIRVESLSATEATPGGACDGTCLMTTDFTPLEPDVAENKFFAPGLGMIAEVNPDTGDRVELTEFTSAP
ncbi:MAG: hypothetical protein ACE5KS_06090 [Woeseiaceae bacterium]